MEKRDISALRQERARTLLPEVRQNMANVDPQELRDVIHSLGMLASEVREFADGILAMCIETLDLIDGDTDLEDGHDREQELFWG